MTLNDFITEWTGKVVDFDGAYPGECMDLMHQYVYEVLGITDKTVLKAPSANQVYVNFKWPQIFTRIDNTPTGVPAKGDIVFFGVGVGQYGHTCIFVAGNDKEFVSFDSNWPFGSTCHLQLHSYKGVLGWLHKK